jgi:hypothetical protein
MKFPFSKRMNFEPVPQEGDELIEAINSDPQRQDDIWQLHDDIDPTELNSFWDEALKELKGENNFSD